MACIHIWTIEHRSRLRAEDVSRPKLEAHILTIMVGNINGKTALTLVVAVFNHGAPSIVKDSKAGLSPEFQADQMKASSSCVSGGDLCGGWKVLPERTWRIPSARA